MWKLRQAGLDRQAHHRHDFSVIEELKASSEAQLSLFDERLRVLVQANGQQPANGIHLKHSTQPQEWIFLGLDENNRPHFSVNIDSSKFELSHHQQWYDLRLLLPVLTDQQAAPFAQGKALVHWHATHRFCGRCSARMEMQAAGHERSCQNCDNRVYPRTDPAVIMAVTNNDKILLARQPQWPRDRYSVLAGFVEPGESFEQTVAREVREEVGISVDTIKYIGSQPWPFPASIMIGFFAEATSTEILLEDEEIEEAFWVDAQQLKIGLENQSIKLPVRGAISYALIQIWAKQYDLDVTQFE